MDGNDARVVEFEGSDLPGFAQEPMIRDVVDHGLTCRRQTSLAASTAEACAEGTKLNVAGRSRDCPDGFGAGRLRKASEFLDAAEVVEQEMLDAAVNLYVLANVAASGAICCSRLGRYALGENHHEAVALLLLQLDDTLERHLSTLLGVKSKVAYTQVGYGRRTEEGSAIR